MATSAEPKCKKHEKVVEVHPDQLLDADAMEQRHVKEVYEAIAPHFSATRYKAWPRVRYFIESLPKYAAVADVGCGNGKYFTCFQNFREPLHGDTVSDVDGADSAVAAHRFVVGVDTSEGLLRLAQKQQRQREMDRAQPSSSASLDGDCGCTDLLRADGRRTPLRDGIFDAAISIAVVHHFVTRTRRLEAVRELLRLVRHGGRVLISVWAKDHPEKRARDAASDVFIRWEMHEAHDPDRHIHHRYYHLFSEGELEQLVKEAGGIVRESYFDKENWCVIMQKEEKQ
uniref:Uncharacterized protein TCIL3000_10_6520 n=1 Tax=Trypanosoma congolense (strain IL3000) TaxID=1068625 RepID=G0UWW2_TRYCI|nr:unnamed protein product [Trypanosoma congolense IL3000]